MDSAMSEPRTPNAPKLSPHDSERLERYALAALPGLLARLPVSVPQRPAQEAVALARQMIEELDGAGYTPSGSREISEFVTPSTSSTP